MRWVTSRFDVDLAMPQVMGIVNVTPDSFSDGGRHATTVAALSHCEQLLKDGAHMLDIGGESTRPGSPAVGLEEELARVLPVVQAAVALGVPVSVDTYKPEVMRAVLDAGADVINDIWALRQGDALAVVAAHPRCGVCLMHMHRDPQTMQVAPMAGDVVGPVAEFLSERASALTTSGVAAERIVLDPGIGFGKTVAQNLALTRHLPHFADFGLPLLMGWSRKSSLGAVTDLPVGERLAPSLAAALLSVQNGAQIVRVHDVAQTRAVLQVWQALQAA